mgnify:CR=1 FL=1
MEKLDGILERAQEGISRRQRASLALADLCGSEPDWQPNCEGCKKPQGAIRFEHEGQTFRLACPWRADSQRCPLARADLLKAAQEKTKWLRERGLLRRYHGMRLEQVDPRARDLVAGYLERLQEHVRAGRGLLITGTTGAGKTALLGLIAERAYDLGITDAQFAYCYDLYAAFYRRDEEAREQIRRWRECRLLLLDEFGAPYGHDFPASEFEGFCEHRHADHLTTCVTTNLSVKAIQRSEEWSRIYDRWRSTCWGLALRGTTKRQGLEGAP